MRISSVGPQVGAPGAQGTVYEDPRSENLVKLYPEGADVDRDGLRALVEWPHSLSKRDQRRIAATTAWPLSVVEYRDQVGITMRRAPRAYYFEREGERTLRELQWAFVGAARFSNQDLVTPRQAIAITYRLAQTLSVFQRNGIVYCDASGKNILWASNGHQQSIFLLDCDSVGLLGAPRALSAVQTPLFEEPWIDLNACSTDELMQVDRFKLGIVFLRIYFRTLVEVQATTRALALPSDPPLTRKVVQLLEASLGRDPQRPHPDDWLQPLARLERRLRATGV